MTNKQTKTNIRSQKLTLTVKQNKFMIIGSIVYLLSNVQTIIYLFYHNKNNNNNGNGPN